MSHDAPKAGRSKPWRKIAEGIGLSLTAMLFLNGWSSYKKSCGSPNGGSIVTPAVPNRITGQENETVVSVSTTGARQLVARLVIDQVITLPNRRTIGSTSAPVAPGTDMTTLIVRFAVEDGQRLSDTLRIRALDACGNDIASVDIPSEIEGSATDNEEGFGGSDSIRATLAIPGDGVPKCSPSPSPSPSLNPSPTPTPTVSAATVILPQQFPGALVAAVAESNAASGTIRTTLTQPFAYQQIRRQAIRTVTPNGGAPYTQGVFTYAGAPEVKYRLEVATLGDATVAQAMRASSREGNFWADLRMEENEPHHAPSKFLAPIAGSDLWEIKTTNSQTATLGWLRGEGPFKLGYQHVMNAWTAGGGTVTLRLITPDGTAVLPTLINATETGIDATVTWPSSGGLSGYFEWRFSAGGKDVAIYTSNALTLATEPVTTVRGRMATSGGGGRTVLPVGGAPSATAGTDHAVDGN